MIDDSTIPGAESPGSAGLRSENSRNTCSSGYFKDPNQYLYDAIILLFHLPLASGGPQAYDDSPSNVSVLAMARTQLTYIPDDWG